MVDLDLRSAQSVGGSITTSLEIEATGETMHIEAERSLTLLPGVLGVVDLRPKGVLIVRKRRNVDDVQLPVEWLPCSTDGWPRVATIEVFDCLSLKLLLPFPAETFLANGKVPLRTRARHNLDRVVTSLELSLLS